MGLFDLPLHNEYILEGKKERAALNGIVTAAQRAEMLGKVLIHAILSRQGLFIAGRRQRLP